MQGTGCFRSTQCSGLVPVLVFLSAVFVPGCSLDCLRPGVDVVVELPTPAWEAAGVPVGHRLVFPNAQGEIEELWLVSGKRSAEIRVRRGCNVPILAYPLGRLKPSGACLVNCEQFGVATPVVSLRHRYGPAVQVLLELQSMPERCETVHLEALTLEMEAEGEGDPWNCELERVKSAIVRGRLNRLQVCNLDSFEANVELPADDWSAANSLWNGEVSAEGADGSEPALIKVKFSGLYPGRHCFYSRESGLELHLYVDKKGGCHWVCDSLSIFSE